ncbi:hypothetical protein [Butyrivibrio sp. YAB3001]|uniref:hypothetical protein n=1 Tax=Butyrivibrio sp. YAB3001 TaxID=1520812 RepID=UPI0008F62581|nr:hypothetical protein [Butyrivibrio sp. YAB3001]SFC77136.1 hypothetical protein SAMN02910398_03104 [Butyrivibrio sp. YAB3001]
MKNKIKELMDFFTIEKRIQSANVLFYIALGIELVLMIVEKSALSVPFESYVFRLTFAITFAALLLIPHDKKEWSIIAVVLLFTFICYRINGKNDLLRFAVFVMSAKNIDLRTTMKGIFYTTLAGFSVIALLSVLNIMGSVSVIADYGREEGTELRYAFGFGHPNTLWGSAFALMLIWLWLYGKKARIWQYLILLAAIVGLYKITVSRTAFAIGIFTFVIAFLARFISRLFEKMWTFIATGIVTPVLCAVFSAWAAGASYIPRYYWDTEYYVFVYKLDAALNNRLHNLYRANNRHAGALETWKLFSDRLSEEYFDMGWVRIFYWYGIIPGVLICLLLIFFIYLCYKHMDIWTLILILAISIYSIVEATFVSVYIGRNFLLPILGVYLGDFWKRKYYVKNC